MSTRSLLLFVALEPVGPHVRLMLSEPMVGTSLKARLPSEPAHERSVVLLLEALALWYGQPLHAVIDADASDVRRHPERWARLLGDAGEPRVRVEWVGVPRARKHDRFLEPLGDFSEARRLLSFAATGQR
jgi:hypothetical protein